MGKIDVAAYIWPAYTGDEPRTRIFWPEGIGEWQTVKNQERKPNGYLWNRKPLWGYVNEADPYVMEMEIEAAADHGVNVFIYDWYWYDNAPFLEQCLDNGYLKAKNNDKVKFYIMWANHNAMDTWDKRNAGNNTMIWSGRVTMEQFEAIGKRWLDNYLCLDNYYKIDGKPVVSIYDLKNLIIGLGGVENTKKALARLNDKAKEYGLSGIHFQYIKWGDINLNLSGVDGGEKTVSPEDIKDLGFESVTHYQFVHFADISKSYEELSDDLEKEWKNVGEKMEYFPHISIGWDNNPRYNSFRPEMLENSTPENFEKLLRLAKCYAEKNSAPLVTINSWNEWTETSYLEPDDKYGYGYLEAVKRVFGE